MISKRVYLHDKLVQVYHVRGPAVSARGKNSPPRYMTDLRARSNHGAWCTCLATTAKYDDSLRRRLPRSQRTYSGSFVSQTPWSIISAWPGCRGRTRSVLSVCKMESTRGRLLALRRPHALEKPPGNVRRGACLQPSEPENLFERSCPNQ